MILFSRLLASAKKTPISIMLGGLALTLLVFVSISRTAAQKSPEKAEDKRSSNNPPTAFECRWANGPITLDGKADEGAWKDAQVIDHFYLPWLGENARFSRTATKAKLLWDREYLYFHADMEDTDLFADVTEHNGMTWNNDVFELFFKPADDKPGYYEFQVNAAGTVFDLFIPRRNSGGSGRYRDDKAFHVEAKVHLRGTLNKWTDKDEGWSVEGRIPWTDFLRTGGRPEPGEKWKFALCRYDYSVDFEGPELSTCAPLTSLKFPDFHHFEDYATLKFVGPDGLEAKPTVSPKRVPLTTSTVVGSPDPLPPYRPKRVYPDMKVNFPIFIVSQPGSDLLLFIDENGAYGPTKVRRMTDDPKATEIETLLDMKGTAYDICFHPDFKNNGYLYLGWNGTSLEHGDKKHTTITRYTMSPKPPYTFDPKSAKVIIEWPSDGHNGGAICFGKDGMMYVTSGDGTSDSDRDIVGQDMTRLTAKVLRIDVDHPDEGKTYSVPKGNPFLDNKEARPETWAYGLRNPWRMTADKEKGHIWVGNNGQDLWEQAYLIKKGENYGWSVWEGSHEFYPNRMLGPTPAVKPTIEHHHSEFRSLTGGIVYYGEKFPELRGAYIYGDYSTGKIWAMKHNGTEPLWHKELADSHLQITGFGTDQKGEILICDHRGKDKGGFYTLEPTPKDLPPSTFPRKLSESGLFRSVKGHEMQSALVPYSVNAPFWSDGAHKERWIALPGADSTIEFGTGRGWGFPDKTVIVKSFALETEEGKPETRRWIETRFLTKQDGEWNGYTYLWNDEQTDATLIDAKGMDREFTIKVPVSKDNPDGVRKQVWHYPSRAECLVCHSRAANFVLGLTEAQMNKEHEYKGVKVNQLKTLETLGMLRVNAFDEMKNRLRDEAKAKGLADKDLDNYVDKMTATRLQRDAKQPSMLLSQDPSKYRKLANPYDAKADLDARARAFLHVNCASCHVDAGGGNAQIDLEFVTKLDKMRVLDVKPQHHTFDLPNAKLIVAGHPESSVLLHRLSNRGPGHMPPLATNRVDTEAVKLMTAWISHLKPEDAQSAVVPDGAKLEKVWSEGEFTEGPAYGPDGCIYFSDIGNRIMKYDPKSGKTVEYRNPSGRANGLDFDAQGRLVAAEGANTGGNRRVTITEKDGTIRVLADGWKGKRFNSPNDLTIDTKGRVYFTDPRYVGDEKREIDTESVYRIDPDGTVTQIITDVQKPNGIILAPDMKTLYLVDHNPKGNQHLLSFPLNDDGSVGTKKVLYDFGKDRGIDGMSIDVKGNIYAAAGDGKTGGIWIFSPKGEKIGFVHVPETPSNCVFGDKDRKTLYVTAGQSLYKIKMAVEGFAIYWPKE